MIDFEKITPKMPEIKIPKVEPEIIEEQTPEIVIQEENAESRHQENLNWTKAIFWIALGTLIFTGASLFLLLINFK